MTTYERVVDGEVVERVTPIDGSHEDTRLGVLVMEGGSEWRVHEAAPPPTDEAPETPEGAASAPDTTTADTNVSEESDGAATTDGDGTGTDGDKPRSRRQQR